jgi:hypothetical protein
MVMTFVHVGAGLSQTQPQIQREVKRWSLAALDWAIHPLRQESS